MKKGRKYLTEQLMILFLICLFVYALLCFASCGTPRIMSVPQKDSIRTVMSERIIYRDTTIYAQVPAESDKAVLQDTDTSHLETGLAESEAFLSGGKLYHTLRNKSENLQPIYVKIPEKAHTTEHFHLSARSTTIEVERKPSGWEKFIQALGLGSFVAIAAALLYMIIRFIMKFG